jgi:hypothetical protein
LGFFYPTFLMQCRRQPCRRLDISFSMTPSTAAPAAPTSAAGSNLDTRAPDLQVDTLRRLYAIGLPFAVAIAPHVFGQKP